MFFVLYVKIGDKVKKVLTTISEKIHTAAMEKKANAAPEKYTQCTNEECNRIWTKHDLRPYCCRCGHKGEGCNGEE